MIRIRAFRAIDDFHACNLYANAHMDVLKIFGITKITTANNSWIYNPDVYVILAEAVDDKRPLGGARIHLYNETHALPLVDAVKNFDQNVFSIVNEYAKEGTSEICGLWNSREVAGFGLGTLFLARAGIAMATQLSTKSMFVLCGEHTIGITLEKGFVVMEKLGDKGTFNYPKEGLVATAGIMNDIADLSNAKDTEREIITSLRNNLIQTRTENSPKGLLEIRYDLKLTH